MLNRLAYGVLGIALGVLLCCSCTDTEDSGATMAEEISGGASDAQVIQASLPPAPPSVPKDSYLKRHRTKVTRLSLLISSGAP